MKLIKLGDIIIFIGAVLLLITLAFTLHREEVAASVSIQSGSSQWQYPLSWEGEVTIPGLQGNTVLSFHDNAVSIISSPCPTGSCIGMGSISQAGTWLACLPNGVMLMVTGTQEVDDVAR